MIHEVTVYRGDFKKPCNGDADFFEDILEELGIPKEQWDNIDEVTMKVNHKDYFTG